MFSFFSQNLFSQDRKKMDDGRRERMEILKKRMDNKDANVKIVGAANSHKFDIGTPAIESILIS